MNKDHLIKSASYFVDNCKDNIISKDIAFSDNVVGMKMYDHPIFSFGAADDENFILLKDPSVIGEHFLLPTEWLPHAQTVISFFLPLTEAVKESNQQDMSWPSDGWLYARFHGQAFINKLCQHLNSGLIDAGYNSLVPSLDEKYRFTLNNASQHPDNNELAQSFTSNWSERHAAFVCGLGTFGLSKGLITKKGIAGRFGSIITELYLSPDKREYNSIYEYCSMCGACVKNCPVNAISIEYGKNHSMCSKFLDKVYQKHNSAYGCGKCQVGVPCENGIPEPCSEALE